MNGRIKLIRDVLGFWIGPAALFTAGWVVQHQSLGLAIALVGLSLIAPCIALTFIHGESSTDGGIYSQRRSTDRKLP